MRSTGFNRNYVSQTGDVGNHSLIVDTMPLEIIRPPETVIRESIDGKVKVLRCTGRWQHAEKLNANGRWYGGDILREAVESIQPEVKARGILGEYDHPPDAKVHLDRVSHVITKLWMENNEVYGELEVLENNRWGKELAGLLKSGVRVGISSRGVGDMESTFMEGREIMKVMPGYAFVTFDVVAEPSVHGSYLHLMEGKQRGLQNQRRNTEKKIIDALKNWKV